MPVVYVAMLTNRIKPFHLKITTKELTWLNRYFTWNKINRASYVRNQFHCPASVQYPEDASYTGRVFLHTHVLWYDYGTFCHADQIGKDWNSGTWTLFSLRNPSVELEHPLNHGGDLRKGLWYTHYMARCSPTWYSSLCIKPEDFLRASYLH